MTSIAIEFFVDSSGNIDQQIDVVVVADDVVVVAAVASDVAVAEVV